MQEFQDKFNEVESTLQDILKKTGVLVGVSNPALLATDFTIEMLFKFIKLGSEIRRLKKEGIEKLEEQVRADGIFRRPVKADIESLAFDRFYRRTCKRVYEEAYNHLKEEIDYVYSMGDQKKVKDNRAFLCFAMQMIPDYLPDKSFSDPLLNDLAAKWVTDANLNYRIFFRELMPLVAWENRSLTNLDELIPEYSRMKLKHLQVNLDQITLNELNNINKQLKAAVKKILVGDDGALKKSIDFLIERKLAKIEEEIKEKEEELDHLDDEMDEDTKEKVNAQIQKKIEELNKRKSDLEEIKS